MNRIPEPELMESEAQARAYAEANFEEPHNRCIQLFRENFPDLEVSGFVVDLGCGPGDIARRFARAYPRATVHGVDGSATMLASGEAQMRREPELRVRVVLLYGHLPGARMPREQYDAVICNSLLHHLADPQVLWQSVRRLAAPGAPVFVMDLRRPPTEDIARQMTDTYAAGEPEVLRRDFYNSLLAAYTPAEVRAQLEEAGLGVLEVREVSDRHLAVSGIMPR
jgi:ubiquinone/menaquinone biosynthesis C-methylase UbiE